MKTSAGEGGEDGGLYLSDTPLAFQSRLSVHPLLSPLSIMLDCRSVCGVGRGGLAGVKGLCLQRSPWELGSPLPTLSMCSSRGPTCALLQALGMERFPSCNFSKTNPANILFRGKKINSSLCALSACFSSGVCNPIFLLLFVSNQFTLLVSSVTFASPSSYRQDAVVQQHAFYGGRGQAASAPLLLRE
jgi:hypothetical protein